MSRKRVDPILCKEWVLTDCAIDTNVGRQTTDLCCKLMKYTVMHDDITLFERFILGYKNYFYRINVVPKSPIRQNRDKDFLPSFSSEGNDATYEFSLGLGKIKSEPDLSDNALNLMISNYLNQYDPAVKKQKVIKRKWTNTTLYRKFFNNHNERFTLFTAIYPFTDHDLSGATDLLGLTINLDDEDGFGIDIAIMGFHFTFHSSTLNRWVSNTVVKRPEWKHGVL